ncbi:tyrosine-type recombinase/integrase [Microcella daejeonensis]|uniref:Tyrosine-type recombinase/integrase n=1 Tax=Microcella daejeonensis TaxID=2994971 RepID=A0A9E8MJN2_9MICO|nr:tyrosine-type recombinase/integrase [Microcella daejeonensis]WAB80799.1 tyrosine-type recombinase/integrase [Microcella daejeonensis]
MILPDQNTHDNVCYHVEMRLSLSFSDSNEGRHGALAGAWLMSLRNENTRRAYSRDLQGLFTLFDSANFDALEAQRRHIDLWVQTLVGAPTTIARRISAVASFYAYLLSEDVVSSNPVAHVRRPRVDPDHSATRGLTLEEAKVMLVSAREDSPRSGALLALLLISGVRLSEALKANLSDLQHDAGHRVLVISRKGGRRQKVVLAPQVVDAFAPLVGAQQALGLAVVQAGADTQDRPLFTTRSGSRWAQSEAFRAVQRIARAAGLEGKVTPHSMRHTHATLALEAGVPLADLQDSLGHADPRTTRRYDRARARLEKSSAYAVANSLAR